MRRIVFLFEEPLFLEVTDDSVSQPPAVGRRVCRVVFGRRFRQPLNWFWWKMEPTLALTPDQSRQIDGIFQEGIAQLQKQKDELDRLSKLSRLIETLATEPDVTRQIDRVEAARSTLNKTRTLMLLHMSSGADA